MGAVLLALSLCTFTSCGDDDEEESIVGQTSNAENGSQEESDSQANSDLIGYYTHNEFRTQVDREADALNGMGMNNSSYWNELAQSRSTGLHIVDGHTAHWVVQGVALSNRNSNYIVYATDIRQLHTLFLSGAERLENRHVHQKRLYHHCDDGWTRIHLYGICWRKAFRRDRNLL